MHDDDKVTTGEIYRRLCDMDDRYEKKLDRIETQVRTTNGRTTVLETHVEHLKSSIRALWHRVNDDPAPTPPALPAVEGEGFSVKISPKIWAAIAAAGGVLFAMAVETIKQWMAKP